MQYIQSALFINGIIFISRRSRRWVKQSAVLSSVTQHRSRYPAESGDLGVLIPGTISDYIYLIGERQFPPRKRHGRLMHSRNGLLFNKIRTFPPTKIFLFNYFTLSLSLSLYLSLSLSLFISRNTSIMDSLRSRWKSGLRLPY